MTIRWRNLLALLLAFGLLAAACSSSDDGETSTGDDPPGDGTDQPSGDGVPIGESGDPDRDEFVEITGVPGVTDDEIAFASIGTKSGNPLGTDIKDAYNAGIKAHFAWRNDTGGIYGRKLVLADELDDELGRNKELALEIISGDKHFGAFVASLIFSGAPDLDEAGVPTFVWQIHATEFANKPALFGNAAATCVGGCTSRTVVHAATLAGASKVATLGYGVSENSKVCSQAQAKSYNLYGDELGLELVYENDDLAFGLPNGVGPEVTAMKEAGVEFVSTCLDLNGMKTLANELARQGMDDVVLLHPNTYNQGFVADAGGVFDGDYVSVQFIPFEAESGIESQEKFFEYMDKAGVELSELAMVGWINAHQAYEGLLLAGADFDRQAVIDARNDMTADTAGGLITPIDWTRQHEPATDDDRSNSAKFECQALVKVVDGSFELVGTGDKPWWCWSNDTKDWSEPTPMSFS